MIIIILYFPLQKYAHDSMTKLKLPIQMSHDVAMTACHPRVALENQNIFPPFFIRDAGLKGTQK